VFAVDSLRIHAQAIGHKIGAGFIHLSPSSAGSSDI